MQLFKNIRSKLFIDFRGQVARIVQGRPVDNRFNFPVDGFGLTVLPAPVDNRPDREAAITNGDHLGGYLSQYAFKATGVVAGLGQSGVITRSVRVPQMSLKNLQKMMQLEINEYLPVSPEEYAFDYKVLDEVEEDGQRYLELMVAAVNRNQTEHYAMLLERAGLKPLVFDILPNMLYRLLGYMAYKDVLIIDGSSDGTRLVIFKGKSLFMYADIPFAVNTGGDNDLSVLASEISGFLDYFSSRNFGKPVDNIRVLGEFTLIPNLEETLGGLVTIPITVGLSGLDFPQFKGRAKDFPSNAALYAGNLGLMMRESKRSHSGNIIINQSTQAPAGDSLGA